ncbi:complex I NDUFA9 subunit family protein [Oceanithermus desulfurans]|uniref:NADH(P)-binding protein n=2 Tax=Oceanithermus desulfurans TaxID=227924 RepID=A0A511RJ00_9DEIN|nr:complex I NDUFA9 subunit family protein [Oceanithermus desulfurans]MBB6028748.1 NADH dehydrogenase [Oceanithermus desulfurans]GEM88806.1 NADH(P)-binding protein [Oceanithermus desulfurans NBRC 100063]
MHVVLVGGSGFLGSYVARALLARGHRVTSLSRRGRGPLAGVRYRVGDAASGQGLEAMGAADAAVYLAGIIREGEQRYQAVHVRGVQQVLGAMVAAGVRRIVHVSALGARPDAPSRYHASKARGEALVRASGLDWTIFRPSLVFGEGDEFFGKILKGLVRMPLPFIPIIGTGDYPFRPVWAGDVAQAMAQSLEKPVTIGEAYDLVGPKEYTYRELILLVRDALGSRKPLVSLPVGFFALLARLPRAPITPDQLFMLLEGNTGDPAELQEVFELEWLQLGAELSRVLGIR